MKYSKINNYKILLLSIQRNKTESNYYKLFFILSFLLVNYSFLIALEVGGHLTEDTIWSPANNPYEIIEHIYVDEGVTLRILPGTRVNARAKRLTPANFSYLHMYDAGNAPRYIYVNGTLIAEGTETDSIRFNRIGDEFMWRWGGIHLSNDATGCKISYANISNCIIVRGDGLNIGGGLRVGTTDMTIIKNIKFENCQSSICLTYQTATNYFEGVIFENGGEYFTGMECNVNFYAFGVDDNPEQHVLTVAECIFRDESTSSPCWTDDIPINFINNEFYNFWRPNDNDSRIIRSSRSVSETTNYYGNKFINCNVLHSNQGFRAIATVGDTAYVSHNYAWADSSLGLKTRFYYSGEGDFVFNDNEFSYLYTLSSNASSQKNIRCYNNLTFDSANINLQADSLIISYNNIAYSGYTGFNDYCLAYVYNNSFIRHSFNPMSFFSFGRGETSLFNNVLIWYLIPDESNQGGMRSQLDYYNNCMPELYQMFDNWTDLGNNIIVDPLLNEDMSLSAESPCIDAGFQDSLFTPLFDFYGNVRTVDGDGDGIATIDIGAIEYNSEPLLCGISGYIINQQTGEPIKASQLKLPYKTPEWSDSTGYFRFNIAPGTYTMKVMHPWFEDQIISEILVEMGSLSEQVIYLNYLYVDNENVTETPITILTTNNYPNPFNPETTIKFSLPQKSKVLLEVYNIKGQLIKTLSNKIMEKGINRVIWKGENQKNQQVSTGVYFYKIGIENGGSVSKSMLLLK